MPEITNHSLRKGCPLVATRRMQIWTEGPRFQGSGCSECGWLFKPPGPPTGDSLTQMKEIYERQRDKEFAAHVCAEHPRPKNPNI